MLQTSTSLQNRNRYDRLVGSDDYRSPEQPQQDGSYYWFRILVMGWASNRIQHFRTVKRTESTLMFCSSKCCIIYEVFFK